MVKNSLQKIIDERAEQLPPELENRMTRQMGTFSAFGTVVELFIPNALQTVVRLIGGEELPDMNPNPGPENPKWRNPPPSTGPKEY
jgi:hypothetical protein